MYCYFLPFSCDVIYHGVCSVPHACPAKFTISACFLSFGQSLMIGSCNSLHSLPLPPYPSTWCLIAQLPAATYLCIPCVLNPWWLVCLHVSHFHLICNSKTRLCFSPCWVCACACACGRVWRQRFVLEWSKYSNVSQHFMESVMSNQPYLTA